MARATFGNTRRTAGRSIATSAGVAALALVTGGDAFAVGESEFGRIQEQLANHVFAPLEGAPVSIGEIAGEVLVVNLWATWCAPCRRELPRLDELHRRLAGRGGRVLAVSIDRDRRKVERYVRDQGLTLPVYHDGPDRLVKNLDLDVFPFTVVIDRAGRVAHFTRDTGEEALAALEARVSVLVGEPQVEVAEGIAR